MSGRSRASFSLGRSPGVLTVHVGQERFEIPLGELAAIGLVEPEVQLLVEPPIVELLGPTLFNNEVELVRLIILDAGEIAKLDTDGLSLFVGEFGHAHVGIIARRPKKVKDSKARPCRKDDCVKGVLSDSRAGGRPQ